MRTWWQRHNTGISAFVAGLCLQAGVDCLTDGNYGFASLEFLLAGLNLWMYNVNFQDPFYG